MSSSPVDQPYPSGERATAAGAASERPALRIALTLPGGITPGTFEAGAVCGLLAWTQEVNVRRADTVVVDVIAGASAGALTGLLAARVLLAGDDPVGVFRRAWVAAPSIQALRGAGRAAPLSLRRARSVAHSLLFDEADGEAGTRQSAPVSLDIALGCLRGLSQQISREVAAAADNHRPLLATSYLDWSTCDLSGPPKDGQAEEWTRAIDSAISSASHPLFFAARSLDREQVRPEYKKRGVINLPAGDGDLRLWYTDGGLCDNEPLGRCLDRVAALDEPRAVSPPRSATRSRSRLVMLLRADGHLPIVSDNPGWSGAGRPRWTQTMVRVLGLVATHSADLDLVEVLKVNARLEWTSAVANKIAALLGDSEEAYDQLRELLTTIERERTELAPIKPKAVRRAADDPRSLADLIEAVLQSASGLRGKQAIDVAVFTGDPALGRPPTMNGLLGFLARRQREDHFAAGYWSMMRWIATAPDLAARLEDSDLIAEARGAAERKVRKPGPRRAAADRRRGISLRTRWGLARVGGRAVTIASADVREYWSKRGSVRRRHAISLRRSR